MKSNLQGRIVLFLIISNEFCERYTFYSVRSTLFTFAVEYYHFAPHHATWIVHTFVFLSYFFAMIGGVLADSFLGRYKTILYFNLVYAVGNLFLCLSSVGRSTSLLFVGLALVAVGTGGIKPCVAAFGGDQAKDTRQKNVELFFSTFYFFINTGGLLGMLLAPTLSSASCFGHKNCYFYAFQAAALIHLASVLLFLGGTRLYTKESPDDTAFRALRAAVRSSLNEHVLLPIVSACAIVASIGRKGSRKRKANAFIKNLYRDDTDVHPERADAKQDLRKVVGILKVFAFVPFFWMLYDQQASFWVEQGMKMDPRVTVFSRTFKIVPAQMQALNTMLVIVMVPLFVNVAYPLAVKVGLSVHPVRKMYSGVFLASLSFVISAVLELFIHKNRKVSILWQVPQYIAITAGEVMLSMTGLEFAYSQSPPSMKSLVNAAWLICNALGNLLVLLFSIANPLKHFWVFSPRFSNQLFFATIGFAASCSFASAARPIVNQSEQLATEQS